MKKEYLYFLKQIQNYSQEEYLRNKCVYGAGERFLHFTIECILDIANHIISDLHLRKPQNYKDIFSILFENDMIDKRLCNQFSNMADFRNILVHDYLSSIEK